MAETSAADEAAGVATSDEDVSREKDKRASRPPREAPGTPALADTLHGKIAEVQNELGVMPKDRHVEVRKGSEFLYSYDYLSESALMSAVREKLARRSVAVYVSVENQRREGGLTMVETAMTFADGPTGETFTISGQGQGADPSDKGVYKAITGAVRYMLWKTFLVPTEGDDPNQPHEVSAENSDAPVSISEAAPRIAAFAGDPAPWIVEAVAGFYPDVPEPDKLRVNDLPAQVKYDLLRRLQRVVLDLEGTPQFDPFKDTEATRQLVRVSFAKAFDGLAVSGPEPFIGPTPF